MIAKEKIFREYDIRGVVGVDFDETLAKAIGFVLAETVRSGAYKAFEFKPVEGRPVVAVGYDCRASGPAMKSAVIEGIKLAGCDVVESGMGPSPQLYYTAFSQKTAGAIQVTASHNPGDQNGFKMMIGSHTLSGVEIQKIKTRVFEVWEKVAQAQGSWEVVAAADRGECKVIDGRAPYLEELVARSKPFMGSRKVKVVVDGGNGVGGLVGPELLRRLGCEVIELFTEPDGSFPNHHPDPTVVANLKDLIAKVKETKADLGIGWDGDADRIGVVDANGEPIFGDMLLVIYGRQLLKEVQNPIVVADVKCSTYFFKDLADKGAKTVMSKTGHSLIKAKLKELHAHLAGEMSGHMFFAHRYYGFDDAIHASARLVEIVSQTDKPLHQLLDGVPKSYSTPEIRVDCPDEVKFEVAKRAPDLFKEFEVNTLDGARVEFEHGWGLVRASNTQPALVMRFEADSPEKLEEYKTIVESRIAKLQQELRV